jgi:hypothetical protein
MNYPSKFPIKGCFTVTSELLKIQAFLSFQILQHIIITMSIAKGRPRFLLMCLVALSGLNQLGTITPIDLQEFLAKGHLKNRCLHFSSFCRMHNSHTYESKCICFLLKHPLVLSLSCNRSQKKNLVLGLTRCSPNPFKSRMSLLRAHHMSICFC